MRRQKAGPWPGQRWGRRVKEVSLWHCIWYLQVRSGGTSILRGGLAKSAGLERSTLQGTEKLWGWAEGAQAGARLIVSQWNYHRRVLSRRVTWSDSWVLFFKFPLAARSNISSKIFKRLIQWPRRSYEWCPGRKQWQKTWKDLRYICKSNQQAIVTQGKKEKGQFSWTPIYLLLKITK